MLLQAVIITGCDLCASAKPWDIQLDLVKSIFDEFYKEVLSLFACLWRFFIFCMPFHYVYIEAMVVVGASSMLWQYVSNAIRPKERRLCRKVKTIIEFKFWLIYFNLIYLTRAWYERSLPYKQTIIIKIVITRHFQSFLCFWLFYAAVFTARFSNV